VTGILKKDSGRRTNREITKIVISSGAYQIK
jgi:hypothetical protein